MFEQLSESTKSQRYLISIALAAVLVRVLVGLGKPILTFEQSIVVGLTTVAFLAPFLHRACHGSELLDTTRKRIGHATAMLLSGGLFLFYVALA